MTFKILQRNISSSTESDLYTYLAKIWTAINRLQIQRKSDLSDKIKRDFSKLWLYQYYRIDVPHGRKQNASKKAGWKLHINASCYFEQILEATFYTTAAVQPLTFISKIIQVRRRRHVEHCWRSKNKLIRNVLLWTPTHGCATVGRPKRTYFRQLYGNSGYKLEDLQGALDYRDGWGESESGKPVLSERFDD